MIEKVLKDPKSAEWGMRSGNWYETWPTVIEGNTVTVLPTFRAKNGFGALSLHQFICKLDTTGDWNLLDLREI